MEDAQPRQSLGGLGGEHGAAVVGHEGPGQRPLEQRLRQTVAKFLGPFAQVPLQVAAQARPVVEDPA